jgi:hypothetical protein
MPEMRTGPGPFGPAGGETAGDEAAGTGGRRAARGAARRERLLRQTRTISLGIAGGATLASLGLGAALAHAAASAAAGHTAAAPAAHAPAAPGSAPPGAAAGGSREHGLAPGRAPRAGHGQPQATAQPAASPPASHVASGGS